MLIEQAVFTAAKPGGAEPYPLLARSPGLTAADARELSLWGPADGALCGSLGASTSVNFHPLPSGASCVGYSVAIKSDHNGSDDSRVYTQCLVVPPEDMVRFANNPFALLRAARGKGFLKVHDSMPACLEPFQLPGQAAAVDEGLLGELVDRWGARHLAWFVQAALAADALVVVGSENPDWLVAGILNCLPVECRPEFSFATGLVHSQRRPFRLNAVVAEAAERRRVGRQMGVTLLDLNEPPTSYAEPTGWAAYLEAAARTDRLAEFAAELNRPRAGLRISDLPWLARQLNDRLQASLANRSGDSGSDAGENVHLRSIAPAPAADFSFPGPRLVDIRPKGANPAGHGAIDFAQDSAPEYRHAHRAHSQSADSPASKPRSTGPALDNPGPSAMLAGSDRALLEKLEHLDDLVFDTIGGKQPALDELTRLWPQLSTELPTESLGESREQYLRYALSLWSSCQTDNARDPQWAVAALDVLCVLFSADC